MEPDDRLRPDLARLRQLLRPRRLPKRLKAMGSAKYQNDGDPRTSGPGLRAHAAPRRPRQPRRWTRPRTVFVNSMSDLFHPEVPVNYIREVFDVIADTPQHTYQVLTKRSKRLADARRASCDWPPNLWMGVSVESAKYALPARPPPRRSPRLSGSCRASRCSDRSAELDLDGIDWVIAGGESGTRRPADASCRGSIDLRDQCAGAGRPVLLQAVGRAHTERPAAGISTDASGVRCRHCLAGPAERQPTRMIAGGVQSEDRPLALQYELAESTSGLGARWPRRRRPLNKSEFMREAITHHLQTYR